VCALGGCYQPSTQSCYYQCATQGTPCPSGLECNAGMCVTPGETCMAGGDSAPIDSSIDGPPPACGDGTPTRGEICYGTPLDFTGTTTPLDGQLADTDGDGDVDLIYVAGTGYRIHAQLTPGVLAPAGIPGPNTMNAQLMRAVNLTPSASVELINARDLRLEAWVFAGGAYNAAGSAALMQSPIALAVANATSGPVADVILLLPGEVRVFPLDASLGFGTGGGLPTMLGVASPLDLAAGRLTADLRADVAIAFGSGIVTLEGSTTGLVSLRTALAGPAVQGVEIGDINGDDRRDIAYTSVGLSGQPGTLGVMRGNGDGTFQAPATLAIMNLGGALDVRDLDGDGLDDVIAFRNGPNLALAIARGRSDGALEAPVFVPVGPTSALQNPSLQIAARGDFNGDTVTDIVVTEPTARVVHVVPSRP